ncbi:unnamed protein product [Dibothriocephalus latus]|uniref:Uncharacterized protein n=1 Tax=Dibothriocephalus latus TaxID=60516 RepID=A0A3P7LTU8_DIBLA|nr:unnamed protein product [Dibothriocephalus latus]
MRLGEDVIITVSLLMAGLTAAPPADSQGSVFDCIFLFISARTELADETHTTCLGIPLFHTSDSSAAQFLSHILSYVGPVAARIKAVQQSEAAPSDSCPDASPPLLFHDLPIPLEVLCQLCRGPDDIPVTATTELYAASALYSAVLGVAEQSVKPSFSFYDILALKLLSSEADAEDQTTKQSSLRFRGPEWAPISQPNYPAY